MSETIEAGQPLVAAVRTMAAEQIGRIIESLERARSAPAENLHDSRKRLKRLRALLALVRSADSAYWRTEEARFRNIAGSLAAAREAAALVETVDRIAEAYPKATQGGKLDALRTALVRRGERMMGSGNDISAMVDTVIADLREGAFSLEGCPLPDDVAGSALVLAEGAARTQRRARAALERAQGADRNAEDFHDLRKAVKSQAIHVALLRPIWPERAKPRLAKLIDLGEMLGDLNDVHVMRTLLGKEGATLAPPEDIRLFYKLLQRSENSLRKKSLRRAEKLFDTRPEKLADAITAAHAGPQAIKA